MEAETKTILIVIIGGFLMVFLVMLIAIITSKSRRKLLEEENKRRAVEQQKQLDIFIATNEAEEKQKLKIASNLHDQIIPIVAFASRNLYSHLSELENRGINIDAIKKDVDTVKALQESIREISHDLVPKLFTTYGFLKTFELFIKNMNEAPESEVVFENNTVYWHDIPFSTNDQLVMYRICLEVLNNLYKHAHYQNLTVTLEEINANFTLQFAHNGKGITNQEIEAIRDSGAGGIGLRSLQSRLLMLNATIDYSTDAEVAYVKITVPIRE